MFSANSENSPPPNLLEIFIFSNSHDKYIYPQQLFIISELSGGEEQYYQYKIRKHLERDSMDAELTSQFWQGIRMKGLFLTPPAVHVPSETLSA